MFDGIYPDQVPDGADIYAGYVGGNWPDFTGLQVAHPGKLHVSIAVNASEQARVLDVETGDATPAEAPGWAARQRAAGNPYPVIYCNTSTWPAVQAAFAEQGVPAPLYWVAAYLNQVPNLAALPAIPAGAIALQCYDYGGYDLSVVADHWPGLDPDPITAPPAQSTEEDDMKASVMAVNGVAMIGVAAGQDATVEIGADPGLIKPGTAWRVVILMKGKKPFEIAKDWTLDADGSGTGVVHVPADLVPVSRVLMAYCTDPALPYVMYAQ
jgi:hypothetical protein